MKEGNPTVTQLVNMTDVQDVSAIADALEACCGRSFGLIKEYCMVDIVLKKCNSICKDEYMM